MLFRDKRFRDLSFQIAEKILYVVMLSYFDNLKGQAAPIVHGRDT